MTTTLQAHGGGAQPASIDTSGKVAGGVALRVYGFASADDARAAGYVCEGGPAMSVALITDAQIASGAWKAEGDPAALVIYTAPNGMPVEGGYAVPVYPVNGWGSAPTPSGPQFDSAEIGTVNASTVAVTFDQDVNASDYKAGVTIKVNGSGATISGATRQSNHAIVYYVLSAPVVFGDVVTWEYEQASGNIVAEDDSAPLANVSAQSVTNNVARVGPAPLLDLQADRLYLNNGDPVSTWSDRSGNGYNFTQSGVARPILDTVTLSKPAVKFDPSINAQWMLGPNIADNLSNMTIIILGKYDSIIGANTVALSKMDDFSISAGWLIDMGANSGDIYVQADGGSDYLGTVNPIIVVGMHIFSAVKNGDTLDFYIDGSNAAQYSNNGGSPPSNFGTSEPLRLGGTKANILSVNNLDRFSGWLCAIRVYTSALSATNRSAVEAELAARYGVTMP